jgi:hypothetical protein
METFYVVADKCANRHVNITPEARQGVIRGLLYNNATSLLTPGTQCTFSIIAPANTCLTTDTYTQHCSSRYMLYIPQHGLGQPGVFFTERCGKSSDVSEKGFLHFQYLLSESWRPLENPQDVDFTIVLNISSNMQACQQDGGVCQGGRGVRSGNMCFFFIGEDEMKVDDNPLRVVQLSREEAVRQCRREGGQLATIRDHNQHLDGILRLWR